MMTGRFNRERSPERACASVDDWPAKDRLRWLAARQPRGFFDDTSPLENLRPISVRKMERGYGRFVTFALRQLGPEFVSADSITRVLVGAYVEELQSLGNAPYTILSRLQELYVVARAVEPGRDWSFIRTCQSRIRRNATSTKNKQSRMVDSVRLLELGLDLIDRSSGRKSPVERAIQFQDGLIIALLTLRPLRRKNLAAFELGRTLIASSRGYRFEFATDAMKNDRPLEMEWPDLLLEPLRIWLEVHRPFMVGQKSRWARPIGQMLWVSSHGSPYTQPAIYDRVVKRTKEKFGVGIYPHLFRDIAATTLAENDPAAVRAAAPLLGHASFQTTERHYLHAGETKAVQRYQDELRRRRDEYQLNTKRCQRIW